MAASHAYLGKYIDTKLHAYGFSTKSSAEWGICPFEYT